MDKEISTAGIISALQFCQGNKDGFCGCCPFYVYGDDCIKHQNQAAADHLQALVQLTGKQSETLEKLAAQVMGLVEANRWIPVTESMPGDYISVLGYMTDAGKYPAVRECYHVGEGFYFPALGEIHPVSHWKPMPVKLEEKHE